MMGKLVDLAGQRFGHLEVVQRDGSDRFGNSRWQCRCDCGNLKSIVSHNLKAGRTRSCGCLRRKTQGSTE